jgi:hypothetical protein
VRQGGELRLVDSNRNLRPTKQAQTYSSANQLGPFTHQSGFTVMFLQIRLGTWLRCDRALEQRALERDGEPLR